MRFFYYRVSSIKKIFLRVPTKFLNIYGLLILTVDFVLYTMYYFPIFRNNMEGTKHLEDPGEEEHDPDSGTQQETDDDITRWLLAEGQRLREKMCKKYESEVEPISDDIVLR
jgi:hypothetical protein